MAIGNRIKLARKAKDMTLEELSALLNLSRQTLSRYETGIIQNIPSDNIENIADALGVSPAYLMGWDDEDLSNADKIVSSLPYFDAPVSAGDGSWLAEGYEYEFYEFEDAPTGADFALRVRGDSMEPMYSDDDIVFVHKNVLVESGQVGVFFLNGEGYMKMLQGNRLVSLNAAYAPVTVGDFDSFFVAGRVVGKYKGGVVTRN